MLAKKFEKPRNIGDSSIILVILTSVAKSAGSAKPGKKSLSKKGVAAKAITATTVMIKKKPLKIPSRNSRASCSLLFMFSIRNGMRTEIETIEAMETKIKSGILKAA